MGQEKRFNSKSNVIIGQLDKCGDGKNETRKKLGIYD